METENFYKNNSGLVHKPEETISFKAIDPKDKSGETNFNVKLTPSNWKLKYYERSRNRMKITIKLSAEDAVAWKNFSDIMRDDKLSEDDFVKAIFLTGVETVNSRLADRLKEMILKEKENTTPSDETTNIIDLGKDSSDVQENKNSLL